MAEENVLIPPEANEAVRIILDLGDDGIRRLADELVRVGPVLLSPDDRAVLLHAALRDILTVADIELVVGTVLDPLSMLAHQYDMSENDLEGLLSRALGAPSENWPASYVEKWHQLKSSVVSLIGLETLGVEAKAMELLSASSDQVMRLRMFCDVRPVFDDSGEVVRAMLLMNTLRIQYIHGGSRRVATFTLDGEDLELLDQQIQRIKKKNAGIHQYNAQINVPTLMRGASLVNLSHADSTDQ